MRIQIHTFEKTLEPELLGTTEISSGAEVRINDEAKLIFRDTFVRKGVGFPDILEFVLVGATGAATKKIADWLCAKLKGKKVEKLIIENEEVPVESLPVANVIERKAAEALLPAAVIIARAKNREPYDIVFIAQSSESITNVDLRVNDDDMHFSPGYDDTRRFFFNDDRRFRYSWKIGQKDMASYEAEIVATDANNYIMHAIRTMQMRRDGRWY